MATKKHFVLFDPKSNVKVTWNMEGEFFGIMLKTALEELVKKIAEKTGEHPAKILTDPSASKFVLQVEPRERKARNGNEGNLEN